MTPDYGPREELRDWLSMGHALARHIAKIAALTGRGRGERRSDGRHSEERASDVLHLNALGSKGAALLTARISVEKMQKLAITASPVLVAGPAPTRSR